MSGPGTRAAAERLRRRPLGARALRAITPALAALVASLTLGACERESRTTLTGHPVRGRDLARLTIGRSTAGDVERVLGAPDERAPDGALVYRAAAVRSRALRIAGVAWRTGEDVTSRRVARFRFADGVLAQICRERE